MDSASPELGIAVIGYSFMGKAHSNGWRNVGAFYPGGPAVSQRVIVGRDRERVDAAARQYGWKDSATDWRAILERDDVDIVDICTPGHLHEKIALAALAAGKHVLLEKPLANTLDEARGLAAAAATAQRDGVRSMVAFNYRRVPALALARKLIAEGAIGEVREVRAAYLQDWLADERAPMTWRLRQEQAGSGVLGDLGSHLVDLLRFLLGQEVQRVTGQLRTFVASRLGEDGPEEVTVDDVAWAWLGLSDGAEASIEVSRIAFGRKNGQSLEIYGSQGALFFDLERLNELWVDEGKGPRRTLVTEADHPYLFAWWPPGHVLGWDTTFTIQAAEFVQAIAEERDPSPSFADGLRVQGVLDAVVRSDDLRRTVVIDDLV